MTKVQVWLACVVMAVGVLIIGIATKGFGPRTTADEIQRRLNQVSQSVEVVDFEPEQTFVVLEEGESLPDFGLHFVRVQSNKNCTVFNAQLPTGMKVEKGQEVKLVLLSYWKCIGVEENPLFIKK